MRIAAIAFISIFISSGCATQAPEQNGPRFVGPPSIEQSQQLLSLAQGVRNRDGCAEAAPIYRVLSGFGEGLELAQFELGECLLEIESENANETALFQQEALFWLERAAFAGNGRAQRKLAEVHAANPTLQSSAEKALGWTLIYATNGDKEVYGLRAFPDTFEAGLRASLSDEATAKAEAFAKDFSLIHMSIYTLPSRARRNAGGNKTRPTPQRDQRQRRR